MMLFVQGCQAPARDTTPVRRELAAAGRNAVGAALDAYFAVAISRDASRWAALYADDAVIMPPNSATVEGRSAIEAWLKALPVVVTDADSDALEVDGVAGLAYIRGTYTLRMQIPGAQPVRQEGKLLQIYRRQQDGRWLLTRDIWNSNASPAGP